MCDACRTQNRDVWPDTNTDLLSCGNCGRRALRRVPVHRPGSGAPIAGGIVGAIVGGALGGPAGAVAGAFVGILTGSSEPPRDDPR